MNTLKLQGSIKGILSRSEMRKIKAGNSGCYNCEHCSPAEGGDGPCIQFTCEDGWCNPKWSNCCLVVDIK